jgi:hypothetical protein
MDMSNYNPAAHFDGSYIRLNFIAGHRWLWSDSDGERSDKVGHWTTPEYLLGEIDRLYIDAGLSQHAAIAARSMVLTHRVLCVERMESEAKPTFWEKIKQIVMGVRHE